MSQNIQWVDNNGWSGLFGQAGLVWNQRTLTNASYQGAANTTTGVFPTTIGYRMPTDPVVPPNLAWLDKRVDEIRVRL